MVCGGLVAKKDLTLATTWTVAHQAPLSMVFSRQEYWSGLPVLSLGDLPDSRIEPMSPALQEDSFPAETAEKPLMVFAWGDLSTMIEQRKQEEEAWCQRHLGERQGGKQVISPKCFRTAAQVMAWMI